MSYTYLEWFSACSVFCSRGCPANDTGFRHPEPPHDRSPSVLGLFFGQTFGTATLPTDATVASSRSHCEFVYRIAALLGFVKFTWHEPLLIIKWLATQKVPGEHNLMPPGTGMCPTGTCNEDWRAR